MFDENKRSLTFPSGSMVEVPEILKGNAQINFIEDATINIMDLETFESIDVKWPTDEELVRKLKDLQANPGKMSAAQVEYWQLAGKTFIKFIYLLIF
jgi:translation elongation factor P/translation initiation factor 5A